jgi:hypothetical protein
MGLRDVHGGSRAIGGFLGSKKAGEPRGSSKGKIVLYAIGGLSVVLIIFVAITTLLNLINPQISEEDILRVADNEPITKDFISKNPGYNTNITLLTTNDLVSLSMRYPAIYGDLTNDGIYRVEYSTEKGGDGILLLIDKNKRVLKYYRVRSMSLTM